ncbi:hypothetical protein BU24DRAFT_227785 [Aaosphaeria arxii CBS 175.79]|uniref:F-box domain-containing protein n=1 Tax=Aaosphaeria arxii CBS 175.79 TaxID=1450172 RepID=A0A6A5XQM6_9PLEO|nr:uncharacterized protein BU24DRAFT_227785 [Aaosphaeria arxii CBS 175.79]KAF2015061.1 hypothetical protein BU24DRAFT_227785 [Aaosphaeria arxii CBS 175.79]
MPISLEELPYDVLYYITEDLNLDDTVNLCHTCHQLRTLLDESTLCRKTVERHAPGSKEAQLARNGDITYGEAMKSIHSRRNAFSRALPYSARIVDQGMSFTYRQGILCVLDGDVVRVTGVHDSAQPYEIDISRAIKTPYNSPTGGPWKSSSSNPEINILAYSDHVLVLHCERKGRSSSARLWIISTKPGLADDERLLRDISLESSFKIFARCSEKFVYYGTYSGTGNSGHHEWEIFGVSLEQEQTCKPLQLEDFYGTDVGSTIAFEIHNGYFYAVSNQTSFDVEEVDWTSFYHVIRFPVDTPVPEAMDINPRVYRRQHAEGPIHDSWLDLTIQVDEKTNEPIIVEARREWRKGSSRQLRTFYMTEIEFDPSSTSGPESSASSSNTGAADGSAPPLLPLDDPYTHLVGSSDRPNYAPEQSRDDWQVHPEFAPSNTYTRSFILARTKFKGYNSSAQSFIDLVEDHDCCSTIPGSCLRIRVGSRHEAPPPAPLMAQCMAAAASGKDEKQPASASASAALDSTVTPAATTRYTYPEIQMWPPRPSRCKCSARLHRILNPDPLVLLGGGGGGSSDNDGSSSSAGQQRCVAAAVMDERSLIYLVKPARSYSGDAGERGVLVLISFDERIRCPTAASPSSGMDGMEGILGGGQRGDAQREWRYRDGGERRQCCREGVCE